MKKTTTLILLSLFSAVTLNACKEDKVEELKKENEELKEQKGLTRTDSMEIFKAVQQDGKRRFAVSFLDSLKKNDRKLYDALIEESESRNTFLLSE